MNKELATRFIEWANTPGNVFGNWRRDIVSEAELMEFMAEIGTAVFDEPMSHCVECSRVFRGDRETNIFCSDLCEERWDKREEIEELEERFQAAGGSL